MWWRGSRVYRHMHLGNATTHGDGWYLNTGFDATFNIEQGWGAAYNTATPMWQNEAVSVPYYSSVPYHCTSFAATYVLATSKKANRPIYPTLNLTTPDKVTITAGDDFVLLFQVPWACSMSMIDKPRTKILSKN